MEYVIVSPNFPPQNDPEAFCAARAANALTKEGHIVHVITLCTEQQLSKNITNELCGDKLDIHYVAVPNLKISKTAIRWRFFKTALLYRFYCDCPEYIKPLIAETKKLLLQHPNSILITRAIPFYSHYIGYKCYKYAKKWVAHFSDPVPPATVECSRLAKYLGKFDILWLKKIFEKSNIIEVTCRPVIEYFCRIVGDKYRLKFIVAYHLALPQLNTNGIKPIIEVEKEKTLVHVGFLSGKRFGMLKKALPYIKSKGWSVLQYGQCNIPKGEFEALENFQVIKPNSFSPELSTWIYQHATCNLIIDTPSDLSYSPYLPSKFAYAIVANRPVFVIGIQKSEMSMLHKQYGGFGIWYENIHDDENFLNNPIQPGESLYKCFVAESNMIKSY